MSDIALAAPRRINVLELLDRLRRWLFGGTILNYGRYTGGGGYLPLVSAWWYADSAVDMDFANNRYFIPTASSDSNLVLLMHMDGADTSTTFIDSTGRHFVSTVGGDAQIDTGRSKFGGASLLLDGTSDVLTLNNGLTDFTFGTGDYIVDCLIFIATGIDDAFRGIFDLRGTGVATAPCIDINRNLATNSIRLIEGGNVRVSAAASLVPLDTWTHVCASRSSGTTRLFIAGASVGTPFVGSTDLTVGNEGLRLGGSGSAGQFLGSIDEFRVVKGVGVSSDFTPSSSAYSDPLPTGPYFALSCSRASTGYAKNSDGTLTSFANNALRIGSGTGLLVEDARTNVAQRSDDFSTGWTTSGTTVTTNQAVAPDGTTTMDQLDEGTGTSRHIVQQLTSSGVGTATGSAFLKNVDRQFAIVVLQFISGGSGAVVAVADLVNGTITASGATTGAVLNSATIESFANGVYRVAVSGTGTGATAIYINIGLSDSGTPSYDANGDYSYTGSNKKIYAWGAQVENSVTFPSSYIPTSNSSATRAADVVECIGSLNTIFNALPMSVIVNLKCENVVETFNVGLGENAGSSQDWFFYFSAGVDNRVRSIDAGTNIGQAFGPGPPPSHLTGLNVGYAASGSTQSLVYGGGTVDTQAFNITPDLPICVGGYIIRDPQLHRRLTVWSSRLSDGTLQSRTA